MSVIPEIKPAQDKIPFDPGWAAGGALMQAGLMKSYMGGMDNFGWKNPNSQVFKNLMKMKGSDVDVMTPEEFVRRLYIYDPHTAEMMEKSLKNTKGFQMDTDSITSKKRKETIAAADKVLGGKRFKGKVVGLPKGTHESVLAHELGHAQQGKWKQMAAGMGNVSRAFTGGLSLLEDSKKNALLWALTGLGFSLPQLANELDASYKGYKLLGKAGEASKLRRLKAFGGVPTYGLAAAAPYLGYKIKDYFGGYSRD